MHINIIDLFCNTKDTCTTDLNDISQVIHFNQGHLKIKSMCHFNKPFQRLISILILKFLINVNYLFLLFQLLGERE